MKKMKTWDYLREESSRRGYLRNGSFVLHSGQVSDRYFDKYLVLSDPILLQQTVREMSLLLGTYNHHCVDYLAGLETGGMVLATALSLHMGIPVRYVRKYPKEYGTCKQIEGGKAWGRGVIIEDVVTSGKAVIKAARALREGGAALDVVLCMVDREAGGKAALFEEGLDLRAVFCMSDFPE